jgi:hypothetical protein
MAKIAIINDTHAGVRNSSDIFADNADLFYNDILFPYLIANGIKRIIHLGDVFDNRKFINFKSLQRFRKSFLANLRKHHIHMDVMPGNHDTFYKNTNNLNSLKELLGHYMGEITIHMEPIVLNVSGFKLAMLPWVCSENYDKSLEFIRTCKADWLAGHLELQGFDVLKGVKSHDGMDHSIFSRFEKVISGHFHTASSKDNIVYLGAQLEFTWADAHDPKKFHILDTDTRELTPVFNPHTLFERVVYDDTKEDYMTYDVSYLAGKFVKVVIINKTDLFTFDRFIDRIELQPIHELKIAENFNEFLGENVEDESVSIEETTELLDSYVDAVETDLDKNRLKVSMRHLLIEAQAMEIA